MPHKDPEAARAWRMDWLKRSPKMREKQNARTRAMRAKINDMLREHKVSVGCADCGYRTHHAALEFHHVGDDKEINLSFAKSIDQARREMEKCEVLCSNCHRIRHWNERYPCKPDIFEATYARELDAAQTAAAGELPEAVAWQVTPTETGYFRLVDPDGKSFMARPDTVFNRFVKHIYDKELARADQLRAAAAGERRDAIDTGPLRKLVAQVRADARDNFRDSKDPPRLGGGEHSEEAYRLLGQCQTYIADKIDAALANLGSGDGKEG